MKVNAIRVLSYKGIQDSGDVPLADHFTVMVGQNNAGKTALIERLAFNAQHNKPYRPNAVHPLYVPIESATNVRVSLSGEELKWLVLTHNERARAYIPVPPDMTHQAEQVIEQFVNSERFLESSFSAEMAYGPNRWQRLRSGDHVRSVRIAPGRTAGQLSASDTGNADINELANFLASHMGQFSYVFKAERLNLASSAAQASLELRADASNLAGALNYLQGENKATFDRFNQHVSTILPTVKWVSVVVSPQVNSNVTIKVWNDLPSQDGSTYGHSLEDCGTGVGQVLAILFAVMTSPHGRVIVIDEPSSFLHPSAARALIQTLKQYPQHQYVVSTHASEIISAAEPEKIIQVQWSNNRTEVRVRDGKDMSATVDALGDVGARLSDVFGHDEIIWVEGPTESLCFPEIAAIGSQSPVQGRLGFVPLINTGDLEAKRGDAKLVWKIYRRLSSQSALMPQAVAISLDREGRNEKLRKELEVESKGLIRFLPRRVYESFLIHPAAIVAVMPSAGDQGKIEAWLTLNGGRESFQAPKEWQGDFKDAKWLAKVDGARLLASLFSELTTTREEYRKTQHSLELTKWLIENAPAHIEPLRSYVQELRGRASA
jgi:predicted ATPase